MKRSLGAMTCLIFLPFSATGQIVQGDTTTIQLGTPDIKRESRIEVAPAPAAILRGLDKISGSSVDLTTTDQSVTEFGTLRIEMHECRFPVGNPSGDAFARLTIRDTRLSEPAFEGWMVASSPALNALDHPRYDIWVIRCKTDDRTPSVVAGESSPRPLMRPEGLEGNLPD